MDKLKHKFDKLEISRLNLISLLGDQDKNALTFKINKNKWSPLQICFHVIKSEQLTLLALNKTKQSIENLKKSGLAGIMRDVSLRFALKSKIKFKAPAMVAKVPEDYDFTELMKKWETIRSSLKEYTDDFPEQYSDRAVFKHPIAGWMNLSQALNFLQSHFDHHKLQIEKRIEIYNTLHNNK